MTFTKEQLVACVRRELEQRSRVYPRLVEAHKMSAKKRDDEMAMMRDVLEVLLALPDAPPKQPGLFGDRA